MNRPIPKSEPQTLFRQPKTRCPAIDALIERAHEAFDRDKVVAAMYWFVLADIRGVRTYADEIMACVAKWNALGCPPQEALIGDDFDQEQYGLGWAALLWFSQMMPDAAVDWITMASRRGNRDARMFGIKFMGGLAYRLPDGWDAVLDAGYRPSTILCFMAVIVIILLLLLALGIYAVANHARF